MRLVLKVIVAVVALAALAVLGLVFMVPTDAVRERVVALIEAETGRTLSIGGDAALTFYPNIGVTLSDVALSGPPDLEGGPMMRMASLTVDLKLMPLLTRTVEVDRFVMVRPVIELRIDAAGRPNWLFERRAAVPVPAPAEAERAAFGLGGLLVGPAQAQNALRGLRLDAHVAEEGVVAFHDERTGASHRAEAVNVAAALPGLAEPLTAEGDLDWRTEPVAFSVRVDSVSALMQGGRSPLAVTLDSRLLAGSFTGAAGLDEFAAEGMLDARSPSLAELGAWLDAPPLAGSRPGAVSFSGRVAASETAVEITGARMALDDTTGEGDVAVSFAGARPSLQAALNLDRLDVNALMGAGGPAARETAVPVRRAPARQEQEPEPRPRPDQSLTDFIEELNRQDSETDRPAPDVRGWSDRAYDLAPLQAIDADVRLTAGEILYQHLRLGRSALQARLRQGMLTADLTDFHLYDGVGSGRLTLNASQAVPALAVRLDLDGVSALPLLRDAMEFDWISGTAKIAFDLSGAGRSESELVRSLRGNGTVQFNDGAIEGINIPQMVRAFQQGQFREWRREEAQSTDFSHLSGTFTMQDGVARNEDLELVSPLLRITGDGDVDLPREWLDYRLLPRIVASLEGQGGAQDLTGVTVPLRAEGPLDKPRLQPDLQRLMDDPDLARQAAEGVGRIVEQFREGDGEQVQQFLDNLFGGGDGGEEGMRDGDEDGAPAQQRPADMLRQLFR